MSSSDAEKGTLTDAQNTYLKSLESEFKAFVMKESKGDKVSAEKAAKKWKDEHTSTILAKIKQDYPYPSTWSRDTTDPKVKSYIRRYFGNYLQGTLVRTGLLMPGAEPKNNAIFTAAPPRTARQLYEEEEKDAVLTLADSMKNKNGGNTAGCYQTALKDLWKAEDADVKGKFEEAALEGALNIDVARNQRDFEAHIGGTVQDLCTNGALGPAEMVLFASFRSGAGELSTFVVHGHSDENHLSFADFAPNFPAIRTHWDKFSAKVLPRLSLQDHGNWDTIPRTVTGIPIFPAVDFENTTKGGLLQIAALYFRVVWADNVYNSPPYDEIAKRPNDFYDTEHFSFRPTLATPIEQMTLSELSGLVEYLINISSTDFPFIFREKQVILAFTPQRTEMGATPPPPPPRSENGQSGNGGSDALPLPPLPPSHPDSGSGAPPPPPLSPPRPESDQSGNSGSGALTPPPPSRPRPEDQSGSDGSGTPPPPPPRPENEHSGNTCAPPPPPPRPENGSDGNELGGNGGPEILPAPPPKSRSKRKAETQLVPETIEQLPQEGINARRPPRARKTPAQAAEERQQQAAAAAGRPKAKPSYKYVEKSPTKPQEMSNKRYRFLALF
ncbi:hypothetical protein C8R44DRAFT_892355 [Mycena epipterygia]|nr:hypothetical protein C8R44DRAFT_892355 [Mycena epipterygia]